MKRTMRKTKQFLAGFLAAVMLLSLLPDIPANAAGNLGTAVAESSENGDIGSGLQYVPETGTSGNPGTEGTSNRSVTEENLADEGASDKSGTEEDPADEGTSDKSGTEEAPTDEGASDNPGTEEDPADEGTSDKSGTEEDPADEGTSDKSGTEETPADEGASDNPGTEEDPADEGTSDESGAEDATTTDEEEGDKALGEDGLLSAAASLENCQYIIFPQNRADIVFTFPDSAAVMPIEHIASTTLYAIDASALEEFEFEASVRYGYKLLLPDKLKVYITEKQERELAEGRWIYKYSLNTSELSTTQDEPLAISLIKSDDVVSVEVSGDALIEGIDEDGMARLGSVVSIELLNAGDTLAMVSEDEKGNTVYTAMELDHNNRYEFTVEEEAEFIVADPEQVDYSIAYSSTRKAKLTGVAGLKLNALASSAQGYQEIVLNFTAVPNGSDGTDTEDAYYEVKVTAAPKAGETIPAGSGTDLGSGVNPDADSEARKAPRYYYIKKTENINTQSKAIEVNRGDLTAPTACTYEFSVRLVHINKNTPVPSEDIWKAAPIEPALSGNTVTKAFATKNLYYEDKIGFTKKKTKIYTGQSNVLSGIVKYSKNASYLHDLTAVAYNGSGEVCANITCTFKNDNDELYVSADENTIPGKYTVVAYASIGEAQTKGKPQGGTMYQANTSFTLTVEAGINYIDTYDIVRLVSVANKNVIFSAVPVGWSGDDDGYGYGYKAKSQKFTYEIKSAEKVEGPATDDTVLDRYYKTVEPTDKVKNNISVNKNGKVTIKKGYTVDADKGEDYIAVVIKAADFENNTATETVYIRILNTVLIPTEIRLENNKGKNLGTRFSINEASYGSFSTYVWAKVIVLDQFGHNMNPYVTITPSYKGSNKTYVSHSVHSSSATLYIYNLGNISVKAVSTDGGKKSKTVKFKVTAPEIKKALYSLDSITYNGSSISDYTTGTGLVTYCAPKGSVVKIYQGFDIDYDNHTNHNTNSDDCGCIGSYNRKWYNWQYEIKGGKCKVEGDLYAVTPTERTATLSLWPKSNPKGRVQIKFTNTNWNSNYETAPKITLTSGKLYSNKYSNNSDLDEGGHYDEEIGEWIDTYAYVTDQQLTYHYDSGTYDSIRITRQSKKAPYLWFSNFDCDERIFTLNTDAEDLKPGSYKYRIAFYKNTGKKDKWGFAIQTIAAKPTTITVKVNKSPKIKIAASYTLNTAQADSIALKCTPGEFLPEFDKKPLNANIGGKANDFNTYFELTTSTDSTGTARASIKFKDTVTAEQKAALKGKTLTGYVKYSYYYGYNHIENATSKVTIKIK